MAAAAPTPEAAVEAVLRRACADAAPGFDAAATASFISCVLPDDASPDAIAPMLALTLGDDALASRVAALCVAAWHEPGRAGELALGAPGAVAEVAAEAVGAGTAATAAANSSGAARDGSPDSGDARAPTVGSATAGPSADPAPPPPAKAQGRLFAPRLSQAERRRQGRERGAGALLQPREPPLQHLLRGGGGGGDADGCSRVDPFAPTDARLCRHFLAGACLRSDCAFSHDARGVACRFWTSAGGCGAGEACPFMHAVAVGAGGARWADIRSLPDGEGVAEGEEEEAEEASLPGDGGSDGEGGRLHPPPPPPPPRTLGAAAGLVSAPPQPGLTDGLDAGELEWLAARLAELEGGGDSVGGADGDDRSGGGEGGGDGFWGDAGDIAGDGVGDGDHDWEHARGAGAAPPVPAPDTSDAALFPTLPSAPTPAGARAPAAAADPALGAALAGGSPRAGHQLSLGALLPPSLLGGSDAAPAGHRAAWGGVASSSPQSEQAGASSADALTGAGDTTATRLALAVLQRAFPGVPPPDLRRAFAAAGRDLRAAGRSVATAHGVAPVPGVLTVPPPPPAPTGGGGSSGGGGASRAGELAARRVAASLERVATGEAVAALYAAARATAEGLARARNLAFHRATQAYLAGDGSGAARFGRQGRELDERMRAAHAAAAARIFAARNSGGRAGGGEADGVAPPPARVDVSGTGVPSPLAVHAYDLHGLHPAEASGVAEGVVASVGGGGPDGGRGFARSADGCVWLAFLSGTRHHSQRLGKGGGSLHDALLGALRGGGGAGWGGMRVTVFDPPAAAGLAAGGEGRLPAGVVVVRCEGA